MKQTIVGMLSYIPVCAILFLFLAYPVAAQEKTEIVVVESTDFSDTASITIETNANDVEVYLNNSYKGYTPLSIYEIIPGRYTIRLEKTGWQDKTIPILLEAQTETKLYINLLPITGFLRISSETLGTDIYLDDILVADNYNSRSLVLEVEEGYHTIDIMKFGWEKSSQRVYVFRYSMTEAHFLMEKALFLIGTVLAHPQRFNPLNPERLGQVSFNFEVTAPGNGIIKIFSQNGNQVYEDILPPFTTWNQSATWNGRTSNNEVLPEGLYTVHIEARPATGWEMKSPHVEGDEKKPASFTRKTTQTTIDNSIFFPFGTISAGGTSNGIIPSVRLLPQRTILFALTGAVGFSIEPDFTAVPLMASLALTPLPWIEVSFRIGVEVRPDSPIPVILGSTIKFAGKSGVFHLGTLLGYTYVSVPINTTEFTEAGLRTGVFTGIKAGPLFISVSEEVVFAPEQGLLNSFNGHLKTGISLSAQNGSFSISTWGTLFSPFTKDSIHAFKMLYFGTDFSFLLPNTAIIPSIGVAYMYNNALEHNISIRFSMGFLNL